MFQKNSNFFCGRLQNTIEDQSDTSHAVSQLEFFSKIYRASRCNCQIAIFEAKNGEQIFMCRKFCSQISSLSSHMGTHVHVAYCSVHKGFDCAQGHKLQQRLP